MTAQFNPKIPIDINFSDEKKQHILDRLSSEFHSRLQGELQIDWQKTIELQKQEKYIRFNEWCVKNGIKCSSLEWPVAYGKDGQLVGVRAKKDIGPCESYVYVPVNCTINEEQF